MLCWLTGENKDCILTANWILATDTPENESDIGVALDTRPKTKRPPLYKVMLLNDDYTPMEFVIMILERFFGLTHQESFELMLTVHKKGLAIVGVYSREIAETKVTQVSEMAQRHEHPLQCTMEKE
jgi:ATP-dependent Clp protease adaptor protein ClpS